MINMSAPTLEKPKKSKEELSTIAQRAVKTRRKNYPEWGKKKLEKELEKERKKKAKKKLKESKNVKY